MIAEFIVALIIVLAMLIALCLVLRLYPKSFTFEAEVLKFVKLKVHFRDPQVPVPRRGIRVKDKVE